MQGRMIGGICVGMVALLPFFTHAVIEGCGKYSSDGFNAGYEAGFYEGRLTAPGVAEGNFCVSYYLYPTNVQDGTIAGWKRAYVATEKVRKWGCKQNTLAPDPNMALCSADILPKEDPICGWQGKVAETTPTGNGLNPLCIKAAAKGNVDPGTPLATDVGGGDAAPWTWKCKGDYYNEKSCSVASQGKCSDAHNNRQFETLDKADELCTNGVIDRKGFDMADYKWKWTCKGSETKYNVDCFASKPTFNGECNFNLNGKTRDTLTTGETLCTKGTMTGFMQPSPSATDTTYGWSWSCLGALTTQGVACFTHKTIVKGICDPGVLNNDQADLDASDVLCSVGSMSGFHETDQGRAWSCFGTRPQDTAECSTSVSQVQGVCGAPNGMSHTTLSSTDNLCEKGTVVDFTYSKTNFERTRKCQGNRPEYAESCYTRHAVGGECNSDLNGKKITYDEIKDTQPCTNSSGASITFEPYPRNAIWTWSCPGQNGGMTKTCTSYQTLDAECMNFSEPTSIRPAQMCKYGKEKSVQIYDGKRLAECEGYNGGKSVQCEAPCKDHACINPEIVLCDGKPTSIPSMVMCHDCDGCMCGDQLIFNGAMCYNPLDVSGDRQDCNAVTTRIFDKELCYDCDGCMCADAKIYRGATCSNPAADGGTPTVIPEGDACTSLNGCVCGEYKIDAGTLCSLPDGTLPEIPDDVQCTDIDGCTCGSFKIFQGSICSQGGGTPITPPLQPGDSCTTASCVCGQYKIETGKICTIPATPLPITPIGESCTNLNGCSCDGYKIDSGQACAAKDSPVVQTGEICEKNACVCGKYKIEKGKECRILDATAPSLQNGQDCSNEGGCICADYQIYKGEKCFVPDGTVSPIDDGDICSDFDGCMCGDFKVYKTDLCSILDGSASATQDGGKCTDADGCMCGNYKIYKDAICSIPDGKTSVVQNGSTCTDADGCMCGSNKTYMNAVCSIADGTQGVVSLGGICTDIDGCMCSTYKIYIGATCRIPTPPLPPLKNGDMCNADGCMCGNFLIYAGDACYIPDGTIPDNKKPDIYDGLVCTDIDGCTCGGYFIYIHTVCSISDAKQTDVLKGATCADIDGCMCEGSKIFIGQMCGPFGASDGSFTPVGEGLQCADPDGCICGEYKIDKGTVCFVPDGKKTVITGGGKCQDPDGCTCGKYSIQKGSICSDVPGGTDINNPTNPAYVLPIFRSPFGPGQNNFGFGSLYDETMLLPGNADLLLEHSATSGVVMRHGSIGFVLKYQNNGPDPAIGVYIAYKASSLLSNLTGTLPYTKLPREESIIRGADPDTVYFYIEHLLPGQKGQLFITGDVRTMSGKQVTNVAQIQSRVRDTNHLNNTKSATVNIQDSFLRLSDVGSAQISNPVVPLKSLLDKYKMIIDWVGASVNLRDVIMGYPRYMHIMTVQRNGLMKGYEYKYSTVFAPKKCISRLEYISVMARIMHMDPQSDVYASLYETTPYIDIPNEAQTVKYINRAHARGLIDVFKQGKTQQSVLGKDKPVKHSEAKEILNKLYTIMQSDTRVLKPLLVGSGSEWGSGCLTREETAYTIAHILRGNSNIVMGFNDIFLKKLYDFLQPLGIKQRKDVLSRLLFKLKMMSPGMLYRLGLDGETLMGVISAAMKGEEYRAIRDASSVQSFFYEVGADNYDRYVESLYESEKIDIGG